MSFYEKLIKIETLLNKYTQDNALAIETLVRDDRDLENEFIKRLNSPDWFEWVKKANYFDVDGIEYDNNGNAIFWNVLLYLERISEKSINNPQLGQNAIDIMENLYQFSQNSKPINNLHIWWYCAKILYNIPFDIVKERLSPQHFSCWLSVWFKYSQLVLTEIGSRLLPKLLNRDGTSEYVEVMLERIIEVRPEKRPGSNREVILVKDSYWILDTFQKNNELINEKMPLNTIFMIAQKLKAVLEFAQSKESVLTNTSEGVFKIGISRIQKEGLRTEEIGFKEGVVEGTVKQYSKEQVGTIDAENLWTLHEVEPEKQLNDSFRIAVRKRDSFVEDVKKNLPKHVNWEADSRLEVNIGTMFKSLFSDHSYIHFKSLTNISRTYSNKAEEALIIILRDIVLGRCESNHDEGKTILKDFLGEKYPFQIFKRIALFCIDKYWDDYSTLFDRFLDLGFDALKDPHFEVELYDLFSHHCLKFESNSIAVIKGFIESIHEDYKKEAEEFVAYWQFKWLSPLREHPEFKALYGAVKEKLNPKDGKPYEPERAITSWTVEGHKSALDSKEILSMPVAEFVKFAKEFKGQFSHRFNPDDEPDKVGLAGAFRLAIKANPKKFSDEIESLKDSEYIFITNFYQGQKEAWNDNKEIEWEKILKFAISYFSVDADAFRKQIREEQAKEGWGETSNIWLVTEIADLIKDGCKSDSRPFDINLFELIEQLYQKILPIINEKPEEVKLGDALFHALNCTLGKAISSYIPLSLKISREKNKRMEENWGIRRYERFFKSGIDAYIWFGDYLPQINYLDPGFTQRTRSRNLLREDVGDYRWQMFMEGYLFGAQVYGDLYSLMRPHYAEGDSEHTCSANGCDQRLVEHIALGYMHFGELLQERNADNTRTAFSGSCLWVRLHPKKGTVVKGFHGFFWSITAPPENSKEKFNDKIVSFWRWTYDERARVKETLGDSYNSFLSKMSTLTSVLGKIDNENEQWLLLSAPFIDIENIEHNSSFVLERFTKFEDAESIAQQI